MPAMLATINPYEVFYAANSLFCHRFPLQLCYKCCIGTLRKKDQAIWQVILQTIVIVLYYGFLRFSMFCICVRESISISNCTIRICLVSQVQQLLISLFSDITKQAECIARLLRVHARVVLNALPLVPSTDGSSPRTFERIGDLVCYFCRRTRRDKSFLKGGQKINRWISLPSECLKSGSNGLQCTLRWLWTRCNGFWTEFLTQQLDTLQSMGGKVKGKMLRISLQNQPNW